MAFKAGKETLVVAGLILLLIVAIAVISNFWPKAEEKFIELGLLGANKTAEGYFVKDNPNIGVGTQVNWYIYLHNQMLSPQNIIVKVKLLNPTMQAPNDTANEPSPEASVVELPTYLVVNDTQLIPFTWSVAGSFPQNGLPVITSLVINGKTVNVDVPAVSDSSFCMVFELWVYDQSSQQYTFGWDSGKGFLSASATMWFNLS